jgi:hypothetical protein
MAMQAAITQLAVLVTGLQREVKLTTLQSVSAPVQQTSLTTASDHGQGNRTTASSEVTRKLKLPLPKSFHGSSTAGAVENLLSDCEQYFFGMSVAADRQVLFAAGLLGGSAKSWWRFLCQRLEGTDEHASLYLWSYFHAELLARFRAVNASRHARDKMASLKQDGSVRTYAYKLQELSTQVPSMQDEELLDRFIRGLKPRTRMEVVMREPESFDEAVKLADRFDSLFFPGFGFDRQPKGNRIGTNPMPILSRPVNPVSDPTTMEIDVLRRRGAPLTDAERDQLRKIGGCFRCRQPGHIAANCPLNQSNVQRPTVNHVEQLVPITEQPDLIDLDSEPRSSENFTPQ